MERRIESIIFDMDGVLVLSERFMERAAATTLQDMFDIPAKPEEFREFSGMGEIKYLSGVAKNYDRDIMPEINDAKAYAYGVYS